MVCVPVPTHSLLWVLSVAAIVFEWVQLMEDSPVNPPLRHRSVHHRAEGKLLQMEMAASYLSPLSVFSISLFSLLWFILNSCLPLVKSVMHCWACTFTDWFLPLFSICLSAKLSVPAPRSIYLLNSHSLPVYKAIFSLCRKCAFGKWVLFKCINTLY